MQLLSAREMAGYLRIRRQLYGLKHISRHMLDSLRCALLVLLTDLDNDQSTRAFVELCRYSAALGRRFRAAREMSQMIRMSALQLRVILPLEAASLLSDTDSNDSIS